MRRRIATLLLAAFAAALFPVASASGGDLTGIGTKTREVARGFGFSEPQVDIIASHAWNIAKRTQTYGYGDDPLGSPGVTGEDARGTMPLFIGMEYVQYYDESLLPMSFDEPTRVGDDLFIPMFGGGQIQLNTPYVWFWGEFDDDVPIDEPGVGINLAFTFYVDGYDRYTNDSFSGDSWINSSHTAYLYNTPWDPSGPGWTADLFAPSGLAQPAGEIPPGMAWICGSTIGFLVPRSAYEGSPEQRVTEYGYSGDITLGAASQFDPNAPRTVTRFPADLRRDGNGGMLAPIDDPWRLGLNIGYEPMVDFTNVRIFYDEDEQLWANIRSLIPWPAAAVIDRLLDEFFSIGLQWGLDVDGIIAAFFGLQAHDGEFSLFGSTADGEAMPDGAKVMNDGSLNLSLGLEWSGLQAADMLTLRIGSAYWYDEEATERQSTGFDFPIRLDQIMREDPNGDGVSFYPVFDLVTGEGVEPPPTATTTTTTTLASDGSTTTTGGSITPGGSIGGDDGSGLACWLGWGLIALLIMYLIAPIFLRLGDEEWWSCWIVWFIVIFAWAPFLLVGLAFDEPSWWKVPLLLWFPFIGGYTWGWARRQDWWQPPMLYASGGYLALLAVVLLVADSPAWELLLPVFWLPLVAYYLWRRGIHRPWWRQEMYGVFGLFAAFVILWPAALSPAWAWWLPVALTGTIGWWFTSQNLGWSMLRSTKWSWITGFTLVPFLAWWIPRWDAWWVGGIAVIAALVVGGSYRGLYLGDEA